MAFAHQSLGVLPGAGSGVKAPILGNFCRKPMTRCMQATSNSGNGKQQDTGVAVHTKERDLASSSSANVGPGLRRQQIMPTGLVDYWDPFNFTTRSLRQMMDTMDRLFGETSSLGMVDTPFVRSPWDVMEDDDSFQMRFDLPGFSKDEIKIQVEDDVMIVNAEHKEEDIKQDKWKTRSCGKYQTRIALPDVVDVSKVSAKMNDGVLEVCIPKVKKEKQIVDVKLE